MANTAASAPRSSGLPAPKFEELGDFFLVTVFHGTPQKTTQTGSQKGSQETREKTREKTRVKSSVKGSVKSTVKSSVKILLLLAAMPSISAVELSSRIGLTLRAVEKVIAKLKATGKIKRVGPDKGGHWEVIPRPKAEK